MKIAITGASGQLGRLVVKKLKEKVPAGNIVALARSPEKVSDSDVEVREADYDKPETLRKALDGMDTLLLISASEVGKRSAQHKRVIEAAKNAGIKWLVYTSLLHADTSSLNLAKEHQETEAVLKESGIPYTILRNGWYTENYAASISGAIEAGALIGASGDGRISSATREDYAEAAVAVLTGEGHQGKVYELAGDESFTLGDLAAEISRQTGKQIPYRNLPETEYASALANFGMDEGFAKAVAGWDVSAARGDLFNDSRQLSGLIGRPTTPLAESVAEVISNRG